MDAEPVAALCTCGGDCAGRIYECAGCLRDVPWCFGAGDDMPDHCDDCWAAAHAGDESQAA